MTQNKQTEGNGARSCAEDTRAVGTRADRRAALETALRAVGHLEASLLIGRADRLACAIALAESRGELAEAPTLDEASQLAVYLPSLWDFVCEGYQGGAS